MNDVRLQWFAGALLLCACAEPVPVESDAGSNTVVASALSANRLSVRCLFEVPAAGGLNGYWGSGVDAILLHEKYVSMGVPWNSRQLRCLHSDIGKLSGIVAYRWRITDSSFQIYDGCFGWIHLGTISADQETLTLSPGGASEDALVYQHLAVANVPPESRKYFEFCRVPEDY